MKKLLVWVLVSFLLAPPLAHADDNIMQEQARAALKAHRYDEAEGLMLGNLLPDLVNVTGCASEVWISNHEDVTAAELTKSCSSTLIAVLRDCMNFLGVNDHKLCQDAVRNAIDQGARL